MAATLPGHATYALLAATHRNLIDACDSGDFREDLYYRLSVFPIEMPPLYKRASDLPQLLDELLIQHQGDAAGELRFSEDALQVLANYAWPGNIRELSNLVERLAILYPSGEISFEDLPAKYRDVANRCAESNSPVTSEQQVTSAIAETTLTGTSLKAAPAKH